MKKNTQVSACLVIFNEEKIIERCLKSIYKVVDEIIVVHDGKCSDNSLKICKKYGAKIFIEEHVGEAEPHRVFTFEKAKGDWILQIDADEYLSDKLKKALPKLIEDKQVDCYEFIWPYWDGQKYRSTNWPTKKALFRKNKISFAAFPHSEVIVDGVTKKVNLRLEHKPKYDNFSIKAFKNKHLKWARIHAKYLLKDKSNFVTFPKDKPVKLPRYYILKNHPILLTFPLAFYQGFHSLKSGGLKSGWLGIKSSLVIFFYYLFMGIEVTKLKRSQSTEN